MYANIILSIFYSCAYIFSYVYYLHEYFEYLHFPLYSRAELSWLWSLIFVIIPASVMGSIKNGASVFASFTYILIYVPTILTLQLAYSGDGSDLFLAQITFFVCIIALLVVSKLDFSAVALKQSRKNNFNRILLAIAIMAILFIILVYRGNLSFVSLEDVYTHRSKNSEIAATGLSGYIVAWTSAFIAPALIATGIVNRDKISIFVGCFVSIVIYMATASKGTLLMPIILYCVNFLITRFGINNLYKASIIALSILMIGGTAYVMEFGLMAPLTMLVAIVIMRVVATGGILNTIYYEFFQNNQKTYLSQYSILNDVFQSYPYMGEPVGYVIGREYVFEGMNVNANFWASDGLMNAGLSGVLIITLIICVFLIILNLRSRNCSLGLVSLFVLIYFSIAANASFFQALWSGGGLFMLLSFKYMRGKF